MNGVVFDAEDQKPVNESKQMNGTERVRMNMMTLINAFWGFVMQSLSLFWFWVCLCFSRFSLSELCHLPLGSWKQEGARLGSRREHSTSALPSSKRGCHKSFELSLAQKVSAGNWACCRQPDVFFIDHRPTIHNRFPTAPKPNEKSNEQFFIDPFLSSNMDVGLIHWQIHNTRNPSLLVLLLL